MSVDDCIQVVDVHVVLMCTCVLVVDVPGYLSLLSRLFEIKPQVEVHVMCTFCSCLLMYIFCVVVFILCKKGC
jgi:hypothetical protein